MANKGYHNHCYSTLWLSLLLLLLHISTSTSSSGSRLGGVLLFSSLSRKAGYRNKRVVYKSIEEDGSLSMLTQAQTAVERGSRTVMVLRLQNSSVVAATHSLEPLLQVPFGARLMTPLLSHPNTTLHLLTTGLVGDCRYLTRYMREVALNFTMDFHCPPPLSFLADKALQFMQKLAFASDTRALAVHVFILDTSKEDGGMYEITASLQLRKVRGGVAGKDQEKYFQSLEDKIYELNKSKESSSADSNSKHEGEEYLRGWTEDQAKEVLEEVLRPALQDYSVPSTAEDQEQTTEGSYVRFLILPHY